MPDAKHLSTAQLYAQIAQDLLADQQFKKARSASNQAQQKLAQVVNPSLESNKTIIQKKLTQVREEIHGLEKKAIASAPLTGFSGVLKNFSDKGMTEAAKEIKVSLNDINRRNNRLILLLLPIFLFSLL